MLKFGPHVGTSEDVRAVEYALVQDEQPWMFVQCRSLLNSGISFELTKHDVGTLQLKATFVGRTLQGVESFVLSLGVYAPGIQRDASNRQCALPPSLW